MINLRSLETIRNQTQTTAHVKPDYAKYNFANIPGTILNLLGAPADNGLPADVLPDGRRFEKVIFFFIDAFGWKQFEKHAQQSAVLKRFIEDGVVSQLTSQFPSTTTAHVTTAHTNLRVGQHGMFEWNYYEPRADAVITPLFYCFAGEYKRGTLLEAGIDPASVFPRHNIYPWLTEHGVASTVFNKAEYASSPFNAFMNRGATQQIAHDELPQAMKQLTQAVQAQEGPAYYFLYWGTFDALCHAHGPDSAQAQAELRSVLALLESDLVKVLSGRQDTLLLVSADHGQIAIDPVQTIYLDRLLPDIIDSFQRSQSGRPLVPGGSCRDFFLYIDEEQLDEVQRRLERALDGRAQVLRVDSLIEGGYFGLPVSGTFLSRVGNLLILPEPGESVWWSGPGGYELPFHGFHGGLTEEEMLIPLLALPL
ncbi:MAG: alkaline phosphatase family protein [Candidatus Promineifilaceae bacterium]